MISHVSLPKVSTCAYDLGIRPVSLIPSLIPPELNLFGNKMYGAASCEFLTVLRAQKMTKVAMAERATDCNKKCEDVSWLSYSY